ncbi:hypothetical protein A6R68_03024, partial [Neotoma lepida]
MDHMISDSVLTVVEEEKVKSQTTQYQRAAALITMILNKDNGAYISFYNALLHEGYKDLAALLHSGLPLVSSSSGKDTDGGITSFVRTVLCEGGVPQRPVIFVTRKKLINAIQQKLWKLNGDPGWVTIYGMAGCGKSVLAAEAVVSQGVYIGFQLENKTNLDF